MNWASNWAGSDYNMKIDISKIVLFPRQRYTCFKTSQPPGGPSCLAQSHPGNCPGGPPATSTHVAHDVRRRYTATTLRLE